MNYTLDDYKTIVSYLSINDFEDEELTKTYPINDILNIRGVASSMKEKYIVNRIDRIIKLENLKNARNFTILYKKNEEQEVLKDMDLYYKTQLMLELNLYKFTRKNKPLSEEEEKMYNIITKSINDSKIEKTYKKTK